MAYSAFLEMVDRLSIKSTMRGSTATICGLIGTLTVFMLCLVFYIPPTMLYFKGNYFQSEFDSYENLNQHYYEGRDFKMAVVFRNKINNSVADHKAILNYARAIAYESLSNQLTYYQQLMLSCQPNYFSDTINPIILEDCFLFPSQFDFNLVDSTKISTYLQFILLPQSDSNPFISGANKLSSFQLQMQNFLKNYYYEILFTSKLIDTTGKQYLKVHSFYSTQSESVDTVGTTRNIIKLKKKRTIMDNSILPGINNGTYINLIWLGQMSLKSLLTPLSAAVNGVQVTMTESMFSIIAYRYYKKLDWLLGIIGGAMLLFYIIIWVPCNFINKRLHIMRNAESLVLIRCGNEDEILLDCELAAPKISNLYWLSNPIFNYFFDRFRSEHKIVMEAEKQLNIVNLLKKIKIVERTFAKKEINTKFRAKVLKIATADNRITIPLLNQSVGGEISSEVHGYSELEIIEPGEDAEQQTDKTFNFTNAQSDFLKSQGPVQQIYSNNITVMAFLNNEEQIAALKELERKSKWGAIHPSRLPHLIIRAFYKFCSFIQLFDFFGAKPNLIAQPHNSTCIGFIGTLLILAFAISTVCLTVWNRNVPQIMTLQNYLPEKSINYFLQTGSSLNVAACFSYSSMLTGITRSANLQFFAESKSEGRIYIPAIPLTQYDYGQFGITSSTSPVNLKYCFGMEQNHKVFMGNTMNDYGYFGFRIDPFCIGTRSYCQLNINATTDKFLNFMNTTFSFIYLPENRFDTVNKKFVSNLVSQPLHINNLFMRSPNSLQETVFVDHVQILDDTKNYFMRKQPINIFQGIAINPNTPYSLIRTIENDTSLHYEVKIHPSRNEINYEISTPKADTILGIIGGAFVFWYAIFHWMGKLYSSFSTRAHLADKIYQQQSTRQCFFNKLLVMLNCPNCLLPACFSIKNDVIRMQIVDKKILRDLHYMSLIKYIDNCFQLSSAFFKRHQQKNLSLVFVKEKIGESQEVQPIFDSPQELTEIDFAYDQPEEDDIDKIKMTRNNKSKVANQFENTKRKMKDESSSRNINDEKPVADFGRREDIDQNRFFGHPKPFMLSWADTYEYTASLTFKGKRQSTSCCGGICCIILLIFIIIIGNFEVTIFLNRWDTKVSLVTSLMQPLASKPDMSNNSSLQLITGTNFKLAVTFGTKYDQSALDVANYTNGMVGISIFQLTFIKTNGTIATQIQEYQMVPCQSDYLTSWLSPLVDPSYYSNTQLGYCIPDGIVLQINGLPQDQIRKSFRLSIFNKVGNTTGNSMLKKFLNLYYPRYHFSVPVKDYKSDSFKYQITTMYYDYSNITVPRQINLTLSKMVVVHDDLISFQHNPLQQETYSFNAFSQNQEIYTGLISEQMYYNLTFDNSYVVKTYTMTGDKYYETFGIIGGLIAFFIFGFGILPRSFNHYKMKYLIGKQLYIFEFLISKETKPNKRGKKKKSNQESQYLRGINDFSEVQILFAYILSFIGGMGRGYNFSNTLRQVTLIQQRVQKDMSIYNVYKKLHLIRDQINKELSRIYDLRSVIKLTDIYPKHVYHPDPDSTSQLSGNEHLKNFAKKNNWSAHEQYAVFQAYEGRVNLRNVFDNQFLDKIFNIRSENSVVNVSQLGGTVGSIGTNSVAEGRSDIQMVEMQ